ncbi:MAG: DNA primase [Flavobacterium sp.]
MITKNTIDKVYETARVEEVIGDFVQLKRAGSNMKGLSPFSDERSPSFMVSPVKQIWKDFSSGKGGNVVAFLMEHEHFTYPEAIRFLAKRYNIEIEETEDSAEDKAIANQKESLYLVSEYAKKYFEHVLWETESGKSIGLTYFKERGFTNETIKKFGLGYCLDQWDAFTQEALSKGYQIEFLEGTGLTIVNETKTFDRFKGRVMFPIQSMSGRILGFGGRILTNDKKAAKYLNSPESDIYHKSKVLYGIFHAKQAIAKLDNCYLVEGYTDVIQFNQAGIENVVASSGTALTPDQIRLVSRLTKNMTVLFDGDAAGLRASLRGIDLILEEGMNVRVCAFPDGEDPDSFAKKMSFEDLQNYLVEYAQDFIQFKASLLMGEAKQDPIKKADLIRDMVVSISKIPDRIKREVYVQECSRIMDISEEVLFNTLAQLQQKDIAEANKKYKQDQKSFEVVKSQEEVKQVRIDLLSLLEQSILEILLLYGEKEVEFENVFIKFDEQGKEVEYSEKQFQKIHNKIFLSLQEDEVEFANPVFKDIYQGLIQKFQESESLDKQKLMQELPPEQNAVVSELMMRDEQYQLHGWMEKKQVFVKEKTDGEILTRLVNETLTAFREFLIARVCVELMNQIKETPPEEEYAELLSMVSEYNKLKVSMTRRIGRMRSAIQ